MKQENLRGQEMLTEGELVHMANKVLEKAGVEGARNRVAKRKFVLAK